MNYSSIQKACELRYIKKGNTRHFSYYLCLLCLFVGSVVLTALAEDTAAPENSDEVIQIETETPSEETEEKADVPENDGKADEKNSDGSPPPQKTDRQTGTPETGTDEADEEGEEINGSADNLERYEKDGITILTGNVKILRTNGYLHADKVTFYTEPETDTTVRTVAESNVEIRDAELFATCEHATMDHLTNTIILKEDVVVIQNKDRLETTLFTYNRTTGKQFAEGNVKFKVRVTEAEPVPAEETQTETGEESDGASGDTPLSVTDEEDKERTEDEKGQSDETATEKKVETPENANEQDGQENGDGNAGKEDGENPPEADEDSETSGEESEAQDEKPEEEATEQD